jgi:hypothetical protein
MEVMRRPAEIAACRFAGTSTFGAVQSVEEPGIGCDAGVHRFAFVSLDRVRLATAATILTSAISRRPAAKTDVGRID